MIATRKIGFVGLDTSHVSAFARIFNDPESDHHRPGGRVIAAYPGGSPDMPNSIGRVDGFTAELRDKYGVEISETIEAVAEASDIVFLESVDGRVHLEQFRRIAPFGKPTFIDKPFATSSTAAREIVDLARTHKVLMMSTSALRYAEPFTQALADSTLGDITGVDCSGPLQIDPTQPGLFWYGIHTVEMVYAALGVGCARVSAVSNEDHDVICGEWKDGRIATIRGNRTGNNSFAVVLHRAKGSQLVDPNEFGRPFYVALIDEIMKMVETGSPPVDAKETLEIVRFIETANGVRDQGYGVSPLG